MVFREHGFKLLGRGDLLLSLAFDSGVACYRGDKEERDMSGNIRPFSL